VRLQVTGAGEHSAVLGWPLDRALADWTVDGIQPVIGLHRHEVRMIEGHDVSYVVKELPDHLAEREWRLLRDLEATGLPTVEVIAVITERGAGADGLLVTRHLDYSLPYRVLLSGRGLRIPYLGERLLDSLACLLVRVHLAGFWWGDCSLSNTLFRRDAGGLSAYIIDLETGERHEKLTQGQRELDLHLAIENVAGGLLDLAAAGQLADGIEPMDTAVAIQHAYERLWDELTSVEEFDASETFRVDLRLRRLHDLGFDAAEMELIRSDSGDTIRLVPRVVEHGFHTERLKSLTGLRAEENQARRLLHDMRRYGAVLDQRAGRRLPDAVVTARWLDERFDAAQRAIPGELSGVLEPAEMYHQILEHRWYSSERMGRDVGFTEAVASYISDILPAARSERLAERSTDGLSSGAQSSTEQPIVADTGAGSLP
jgi:hypothetical protein